MKLTENTKKIFENFAGIHSSLLVLAGKKQKTMNKEKTLLVDAIVEEDFPVEFGIYDLPKFLSLLSLFKDPEVEFGEKSVTFKEGGVSSSYTYCEPKLIKSPPKNKDLSLGSEIKVAFELSAATFGSLQKAARILSNPDLVLVGNGEIMKLIVKNNKDNSADTFSEVVGETTEEFSYSFDIESLKIIPSTYDVQIDGKLARFSSKETQLTYWVPTQA